MSLLRSSTSLGILIICALGVGCGDEDDGPSGLSLDTNAPAVPTELSAMPTDGGGAIVSWEANRTDADLAGYVVYRSSERHGGYRPVMNEPVPSNVWIDPDVSGDSIWYYRVAARDADANESALSSPAALRQPGLQPGHQPILNASAITIAR